MRRREEYRVYPIDTDKSRAVGIGLPFNGKGIFRQNYTTQEQVKSNLTNFMLTNRGERVFNPDYGAGLRDLLFEPQGNTEEAQARIEDRIRTYFPQITVNKLEFVTDEESGVLFIKLSYFFNKNKPDELLIAIQL